MSEITARELAVLMQSGRHISLLDVREVWEWEMIRLPWAQLLPLSSLMFRLDEISETHTLYCLCRSGGRSAQATQFLISHGRKVVNVSWGIRALYGEAPNLFSVSATFTSNYFQ